MVIGDCGLTKWWAQRKLIIMDGGGNSTTKRFHLPISTIKELITRYQNMLAAVFSFSFSKYVLNFLVENEQQRNHNSESQGKIDKEN
jgi:hypothetical protein